MSGVKSSSKARLMNLARAMRLVWVAAPGWTVLCVGLIILQSLAPLAVLYSTKLTLDAVTQSLQHPGPDDLQRVTKWILLTAGAAWAALVIRSVATYTNEIQGELVSEHVQVIIARKATQVDFPYYENPAYFDTLHHAQLEAPHRPVRVVAAMAQILQSALSLAAVAALVIISFHWSVVLLVAAIAGLGLLVRLRNVRMHYRWRKNRAEQERQLGHLNWLLNASSAAKEIRLFGLGTILSERAARLRQTLLRYRMKVSAQRTVGEIVTQACASVGLGTALLFLVRRTLTHLLTVGDLVMNLQALQRGVALMQELIAGMSMLYEHALFIDRLFEFLSLERCIKPPLQPRPFPGEAVIRFENVGFSYQAGGEPVLRGVNLTIQPGEMVALVGENGAGKSTLVKLLCRLYDPTEGRITIGGMDIKDFACDDLWNHIAVLFQDFVQYQATVTENIGFGDHRKEQAPGHIRTAAMKGGAEDFIDKLPRGYEQMLGILFEGGTELSGGQWQKIALSRAFFRDAPIVILDEPTSALDVKSEHDVFTRFKALTQGKTSIVISHRLSTVRMADCIFHLEGGRVTEMGSHDELIELGGAYSELFETQAVSYR